jgi:hypothetical protein
MPNITAGGAFYRFDGRKAMNPSSGTWSEVGGRDVVVEDTLVADIFETPLEASNFQYDDLVLRENATLEKRTVPRSSKAPSGGPQRPRRRPLWWTLPRCIALRG